MKISNSSQLLTLSSWCYRCASPPHSPHLPTSYISTWMDTDNKDVVHQGPGVDTSTSISREQWVSQKKRRRNSTKFLLIARSFFLYLKKRASSLSRELNKKFHFLSYFFFSIEFGSEQVQQHPSWNSQRPIVYLFLFFLLRMNERKETGNAL
jgi:hypothetical protein